MSALLEFFSRIVAIVVLYVASVFLGMLSLGAGISTPSDAAQRAELLMTADILLACAAAVAWAAGLLWIGRAVDTVFWPADHRAPAVIFLALAIVFAIPGVLLLMLDETRVLSDLTFITWLLTPPAAIIALLRFLQRRA